MGSKEKHRSRPIQQKKKERRWPGRKVWLACACCAGLVLCIAIAVFLLRTNQMLPVASIAGHTVNQAELQYYYVEEIADYQEQVSRYGSEYELNIDFTQPLSQQNCPLTSGISWHTYFMEKALDQIQWEIAAEQQSKEASFALTQAQEEMVAMRMAHRAAVAEEAGLSEEEYLLARYGKNVTADLVKQWETRQAVSIFYMASLVEEYTPAEEELEAWFVENRQWNMQADYWAVSIDSPSEKKETVLQALEGSQGAEDFLARCQAYVEGDTADKTVKHVDTVAGDMEDYTVAEWVLADGRQAEDVTVVESYDETTGERRLIALYFLEAKRRDQASYAYQEILLMPEGVTPGEQAQYWGEKQVDAVMEEDLDKTSFGITAAAFSALTSAEKLGVQISDAREIEGQPYAAWLCDEERTVGEIETFETEYGVYLIRYSGSGEQYWKNNGYSSLLKEREKEVRESILGTSGINTTIFYNLINK